MAGQTHQILLGSYPPLILLYRVVPPMNLIGTDSFRLNQSIHLRTQEPMLQHVFPFLHWLILSLSFQIIKLN